MGAKAASTKLAPNNATWLRRAIARIRDSAAGVAQGVTLATSSELAVFTAFTAIDIEIILRKEIEAAI
jgi:hypothetical protein